MSHTNSTQNYQLPQFIGSDIPGWLTDFNSAMLKIDQGMNAAKTAADAAGTTAGQAASDVTTINNTLTTQANQISAAAQAASSAQTSAGAAQNTADANTQSITALDTRVQALEAGGGGGGVDLIEIPVTPNITTAWQAGFFLDTTTYNYADRVPTGKRVVSVSWLGTDAGGSFVIPYCSADLSAVTFTSVSSATRAGKLVVLLADAA